METENVLILRPMPTDSMGRGTGGMAPHHIHATSMDDIFARIWKRKKAVAAFAAGGLLLALLVCSIQRPEYQSTSLVEVQGSNDNILNTRDIDPRASSLTFTMEPYLQTQMKIVQSRTLMGTVIDKLNLQDHPEFIWPETWGAYLKRSMGMSKPVKHTRQDFIDWAVAHLSVRVPTQTHMLEIGFDAGDPKLAANFVNTTVREYIGHTLDVHDVVAQHTNDWLNTQIDQLRVKVEKSEEELQAYARSAGLLFTAEKDNVAEDRLRQLQESLSKAHEARVTAQSKYELVRTSPAESLPEVLDDNAMREYETRLTDLRRQLAELQPVLAPGHYKIQQVQAQINAMKTAIERKRADILSRIKDEYYAASNQENILGKNYESQVKLLSGQSLKAAHYDTLKRDVDTNRQLYEAMLQKAKEATMASAMRVSNISVVDEAKPAEFPYRPKRAVYGVAGLGGGLFAGALFALFPRRRSGHGNRFGNLTTQFGVPALGSIPLVRGRQLAEPIGLTTQLSRDHAITESFRATLVSILLGSNGTSEQRQPHVVVVTSCNRHEGRTTVSANLAVALAEANRKILLIDADLRNPGLQALFGINDSEGLSDILSDAKACESYTAAELGKATAIPNLFVLPCGTETKRTPGLLHSPRAADFIRKVRDTFETVIIDTAPILSFADARTLAKLSDGVALVVRAGQTNADDVGAALQRFAGDGTPVLGTILNGSAENPSDWPADGGKGSENKSSSEKAPAGLIPLFPRTNVSRISTRGQI